MVIATIEAQATYKVFGLLDDDDTKHKRNGLDIKFSVATIS